MNVYTEVKFFWKYCGNLNIYDILYDAYWSSSTVTHHKLKLSKKERKYFQKYIKQKYVLNTLQRAINFQFQREERYVSTFLCSTAFVKAWRQTKQRTLFHNCNQKHISKQKRFQWTLNEFLICGFFVHGFANSRSRVGIHKTS